jgi:hypothetical protein
MQAVGNFHQSLDAAHIRRHALGFGADSAIAGNADDLFDARGLSQLPRQGVLASTAAYEQDFHCPARLQVSSFNFQVRSDR